MAVAVIGGDGRFMYANPHAGDLYGVHVPDNLIGRSSTDFVAEGDRAEIADLFYRVLAGETVRGRRWQLIQADGTALTVDINAAPVAYANTRAVQVELRDMSARAAAEAALTESEQRWRELFTLSPVGIAVSDESERIVAVNAALCSMLGRPETDILGRTSAEFVHPDDRSTREQNTALLNRSPGGFIRVERQYFAADGEVRWAWMTISRISGPGVEPWTLAHVQDITDRKTVERALADAQADLQATAAVIKQIQSGGDARQTIVDAARRLAAADMVSLIEPVAGSPALRVTASTSPGLVGVTVALSQRAAAVTAFASDKAVFVPAANDNTVISSDLLALTGSESVYSLPVHAADGIVGVLSVGWVTPIAGLDDRRANAVRLLADQAGVALRQASLVAELAAMAMTDPLTGLANRRQWDRHLHQLVALTDRAHLPLTVALVDLDHFKGYNDTHGHPAGDDLLRRFATAAQAAIRDADLLARWGGEEFALALPCCPAGEAKHVLARVARAVPDGQTCSIGYTVWNGHQTAHQLMADTDRALYQAKQTGRNRIDTLRAGA